MKNSLQLFLTLFTFLSPIFPQDYLWPVKAGKAISSGFAESRPRRFHSGIDVKTDGTTGHEILAIDDGYVWRVKVSSDGYGRVLYLRLNNGTTAVYAHLQSFMPLLNDIIRVEQEMHNSYAAEKYFGPNDLSVIKGDVLGLSGESGLAFGPHLHFEMRDSANRPLNPLVNGFSIPDRHPPTPEALALIPLSRNAMINGSPLPQIFPLHRTGAFTYEFPDTLHIFGTVGIEISAYDKITGFPNKFGIQGAALSIDAVEQYRIEFEGYSFDQAHLIELERDNAFRRLNDGEFHRLFTAEQGGKLDFINAVSSGRLSPSPGYHTVSIKLFDHAGNVARIRGVLFKAPPIKIRATVAKQNSELLTVALEPVGSPFSITDFVCYSFNEKGYVEQKVEATSAELHDRTLVVQLPKSETRSRILQFIGINKLGAVSLPFHLPLDVEEADHMTTGVDLDVSHLENGVLFQVDCEGYVSEIPELILRGSRKEKTLALNQIRPSTFLSKSVNPTVLEGTSEVIVLFHGSPTREIRFGFKPKIATSLTSSAAISLDGQCSLQALPTTFYDTTSFWIEVVDRPVPVEGGQFVSKTYQLQPFERPLQDSARVAIALSKKTPEASHMGIFYYSQNRGWTYLPSRFSERRWMFFASLYSLEAVAIIKDTIPPVITDVFPDHGGSYDYTDITSLTAKVQDELAGIRNDRAIQVILDGKRLLFEYQPVKKTIMYRIEDPLGSGVHTFSITAQDQVGNYASKEIRFSVN